MQLILTCKTKTKPSFFAENKSGIPATIYRNNANKHKILTDHSIT